MVRETARPALPTATPLERLAYLAAQPSIKEALAAAREIMGVEVACATAITDDGLQVIESVDGDGESFGIAPGVELDFDLTFCRRVLAGELPALVADVAEEPGADEVPLIAALDGAAIVSVPLTLSDGSLYGTLCAASREPQPNWRKRDVQFLEVLARIVVGEIERDLLAAQRDSAAARTETIEALLAAVDARDGYTGAHSRAVVAYARATAEMLRLPEDECSDVEQVAMLHDVGKIALSDRVLGKPGYLDAEDWAAIHEHPIAGERIVASIPSLAKLAPAVRAEHERWDGTGYPDGLAGHKIPMASRIVLVCDAYDAMTSDRPYRRAMSADVAVEELVRGAGTQFDAAVVGAFVRVLHSE
jgi:hypothetical protein